MKKSTKLVLLLTVTCLFILTACGGEDPTPTPETVPVEAPTDTPAPTEPAPTEEPTAEPTLAPAEEITSSEAVTSTEGVSETEAMTDSTGIITIGEQLVTVENVLFQTAPLLPGAWGGALVEDNSDPNVPPDISLGPRRIVITGAVDLADGAAITPYLIVYQVADLAGTPEQAEADALATLLADGADLAATPTLPYLPRVNASQAFHAGEQVIAFGNGQGIRYLTAFAQAPSPFLGHSLLYTFQGLSDDGQYYVAFSVPLRTELFPAELPADFDADAHVANFDAYLQESKAMINAAAASDFMPDLSNLDALVNSILIDDGADASSGAPPADLVGVGWQLNKISYSNDTEVAPDDPTKYTIQFGDDWRVAVQADCNQGGGPFNVDGPTLVIGPLITTLVACPEGSIADEFMRNLDAAASYLVEDGLLHIAIKFDTGIMEFAPAVE